MLKPLEISCDCDVIHPGAVEHVRTLMPASEELYDLADFFTVLGDSTRTRIICALDQSELCVCDLAVLLDMTKSAISHQLASLRQANLVKSRRAGRWYSIRSRTSTWNKIFEKGLEHIREKI
jgi:ArsR family transcriptional regulator